MPKYKDEKPFNPFLPPDPNLKVLELDRHIVVLNKYCILPRHFLLVSKGNTLVFKGLIVEFESQASDLSEEDVQKTWECLAEMEKENGRWLAFYNCGEFSGARYLSPIVSLIPVNNINTYNLFHCLRRTSSARFQITSSKIIRITTNQSPFNTTYPPSPRTKRPRPSTEPTNSFSNKQIQKVVPISPIILS